MLGVCLHINGVSCSDTDGGSGGGGSGGGSGGGGTDRDGSIDGGFFLEFDGAAPVATARGIIRFGDGVLPGQLVGGDAWPVTDGLTGDGGDERLATTGSSAAMLGLLVGGLLSLLMAGPLLARRRRH